MYNKLHSGVLVFLKNILRSIKSTKKMIRLVFAENRCPQPENMSGTPTSNQLLVWKASAPFQKIPCRQESVPPTPKQTLTAPQTGSGQKAVLPYLSVSSGGWNISTEYLSIQTKFQDTNSGSKSFFNDIRALSWCKIGFTFVWATVTMPSPMSFNISLNEPKSIKSVKRFYAKF